jgi:hypothetical protein
VSSFRQRATPGPAQCHEWVEGAVEPHAATSREAFVKIREILSRRNYLSTFVVHLTRDWVEEADGEPFWMPADRCVREIIRERLLRAVTPMGWAYDQDTQRTQRSRRSASFASRRRR